MSFKDTSVLTFSLSDNSPTSRALSATHRRPQNVHLLPRPASELRMEEHNRRLAICIAGSRSHRELNIFKHRIIVLPRKAGPPSMLLFLFMSTRNKASFRMIFSPTPTQSQYLSISPTKYPLEVGISISKHHHHCSMSRSHLSAGLLRQAADHASLAVAGSQHCCQVIFFKYKLDYAACLLETLGWFPILLKERTFYLSSHFPLCSL